MADTGLLIDFDNIVKYHNLIRLVHKIKPVPVTKHTLGLVLVITDTELQILEKIPKGKGRVLYLNSQDFISNIRGYAYVIYDKKRKICEIMGVNGFFLSNILDSVLSSFPNDILLWVGLSMDNDDLETLIVDYIKAGFHDPYICQVSPLGYKYEYYGLCMTKANNITDVDASNEVVYVMNQFVKYHDDNCFMVAKFSEKTIDYLKQLSRIGSTLNDDGSISQKEMAGTFIVSQPDANQIFTLNVDRSSIISGNEEGVKIKKGLYNFHTHPKEAYERNDVKNGWPSAQDFVGFVTSSKIYSTNMHAVVTIEGIYLLTIGKHWVNRKEQINEDVIKFIRKEYDVKEKKEKNIDWYLRKVNSIAKDGFPIFTIQFLEWNDAKSTFDIYYSKLGKNCLARESTLTKYKYFYDKS